MSPSSLRPLAYLILLFALLGGLRAGAQPAEPPTLPSPRTPGDSGDRAGSTPEAGAGAQGDGASTRVVDAASDERKEIAATARRFLDLLLAGDTEGAIRLAEVPFQLEGVRVASADDLRQALNRQLGPRRLDLLSLGAIRVLSADEMREVHGPPPARLGGMKPAPRAWVAIVDVSGRPAVVVVESSAGEWRAVGFTD